MMLYTENQLLSLLRITERFGLVVEYRRASSCVPAILQYDLTSYNYLFDGSDMTKTNVTEKHTPIKHEFDLIRPYSCICFCELLSKQVSGAIFESVITHVLSTFNQGGSCCI